MSFSGVPTVWPEKSLPQGLKPAASAEYSRVKSGERQEEMVMGSGNKVPLHVMKI